MKITLLDGSIKEVEPNLSVQDFAKSLAISLGKATVGAIIDHKLFVANDFILDHDCEVELITNKSGAKFESILSTTGAAISTYAYQQLFPNASVAQLFDIPEELEFAFTFDQNGTSLKLEQLTEVQTKINAVLKQGYEIHNKKVDNLDGLELNEYQDAIAREALALQGFVVLTYINDFLIIAKNPVATQHGFVKNILVEQLTGSY